MRFSEEVDRYIDRRWPNLMHAGTNVRELTMQVKIELIIKKIDELQEILDNK